MSPMRGSRSLEYDDDGTLSMASTVEEQEETDQEGPRVEVGTFGKLSIAFGLFGRTLLVAPLEVSQEFQEGHATLMEGFWIGVTHKLEVKRHTLYLSSQDVLQRHEIAVCTFNSVEEAKRHASAFRRMVTAVNGGRERITHPIHLTLTV